MRGIARKKNSMKRSVLKVRSVMYRFGIYTYFYTCILNGHDSAITYRSNKHISAQLCQDMNMFGILAHKSSTIN